MLVCACHMIPHHLFRTTTKSIHMTTQHTDTHTPSVLASILYTFPYTRLLCLEHMRQTTTIPLADHLHTHKCLRRPNANHWSDIENHRETRALSHTQQYIYVRAYKWFSIRFLSPFFRCYCCDSCCWWWCCCYSCRCIFRANSNYVISIWRARATKIEYAWEYGLKFMWPFCGVLHHASSWILEFRRGNWEFSLLVQHTSTHELQHPLMKLYYVVLILRASSRKTKSTHKQTLYMYYSL